MIPFRNTKEKFLSLDIGAEETTALYFHITHDRRVVIERFEPRFDLPRFLKAWAHRATQATWEGEYFFKGRRKIVATADPRIATTIPIPFVYRREIERYAHPITIDELDDQIAQTIPKAMTRCRAEVARRLDVAPIEAVLVGIRAAHVTIDGKRTSHPVGFIGKEISMALELIFVRRDLFEAFRALFNAPEPFFFFESPEATTQLLSRVRDLPINLVVPGGPQGDGGLFILQSPDLKTVETTPVLYRESFAWSFDLIIQAIIAEYAVSEAVAGDMYQSFMRGELSPTASRHIGNVIAPAREAFLLTLQKAKLSGPVFSLGAYALPFSTPYRDGAITIEEIPFTEIFAKFDIDVHSGPLATRPDLLLRHLAPFLLMYFDRTQGALNERLRRKVHWLTG